VVATDAGLTGTAVGLDWPGAAHPAVATTAATITRCLLHIGASLRRVNESTLTHDPEALAGLGLRARFRIIGRVIDMVRV
jgi:hypothetical protein